MPPDGIPETVRQFIFEYVDSVEVLEVLLLLVQRNDRVWCAREISDELRANPTSVENRLATLKALELIEELDETPIRFRYAPKSPTTADIVKTLCEVYKVRRHRVYELIFSPLKRARKFADAFKVFGQPKNEDKDG